MNKFILFAGTYSSQTFVYDAGEVQQLVLAQILKSILSISDVIGVPTLPDGNSADRCTPVPKGAVPAQN